MDPEKKAKSFLQRFLKIKRRLQGGSSQQDEVCLRRDTTDSGDLRHRYSFRRSLKKMHSRVKNCMFPQPEAASKRPATMCAASQLQRLSDTPPPVPERPKTLMLRPRPQEERGLIDFRKLVQCNDYARRPPSPPRAHRIPTDEIVSLSNCYWYWGPMATSEAEERLKSKPDGTFLVRDSTSTSYLFSISFRSVGITMHARIEYSRGRYNLCGAFTEGFCTVTDLIEDAMNTSENGIYCYSRRGEHSCEFPVRLTKPISRYTEVRPLRFLCRFVIRQNVNVNDIPKLPLPTALHEFLREKPYF